MTALDRDALSGLAAELPAWRLVEDQLVRSWEFPDSQTAAAFAHFVATFGNASWCSPVVQQYGFKVTVRLATPQSGGVTAADVELARVLGAAG